MIFISRSEMRTLRRIRTNLVSSVCVISRQSAIVEGGSHACSTRHLCSHEPRHDRRLTFLLAHIGPGSHANPVASIFVNSNGAASGARRPCGSEYEAQATLAPGTVSVL